MPDTAGPDVARPARVLPPEALAGLREAFAREVAERLPRLLDGPLGPDALRDAHALGSSSVVLGEAEASRTARALEAELGSDAPDPECCTELVQTLADQLEAWLPS